MIGQRKSWSGPANPSGARFYAHRAATKMAVSAHVWGEDIVDKVAQITTTRGPHKFAEWEHCDVAWVAMIDTCASYPYCSSRRPVEDLTRKDWRAGPCYCADSVHPICKGPDLTRQSSRCWVLTICLNGLQMVV